MVFLAEPNPPIPNKRKRPNNGLPFTNVARNDLRTTCKLCPEGVYTGDDAVWIRGRLIGLAHRPCAQRAGVTIVEQQAAPQPEPAAPATVRSWGARVTDRQVEMLQLKADGLTDAQIGEQLGVSARTVGNILRAARDRLGAASTADAVEVARRAGLIRAKEA